MAHIRSSSPAPSDSSEEILLFAGRDASGRPRPSLARAATASHASKIPPPGEPDVCGASEEQTESGRPDSQASLLAGGAIHESGERLGLESRVRDKQDNLDNPTQTQSKAQSQPAKRPLAEPPVLSYTKILERQTVMNKWFLKDPTITPIQRCQFLDLNGEVGSLGLYGKWVHDELAAEVDEKRKTYLKGLQKQVCDDFYDVYWELFHCMAESGIAQKIAAMRASIPKGELCLMFCEDEGKHHQYCHLSEDFLKEERVRHDLGAGSLRSLVYWERSPALFLRSLHAILALKH